VKSLLVISSAIHYIHDGRLFSYIPYAREIDLWADLFPELIIAAPCRATAPPPDCAPFSRSNISVIPQLETGGNTLNAKIKQIALLPALIWGLCRAMRRADAIHVRCPGNLGLLGAALAPFFSRYRVAKYAGEWRGFPGEAWSFRLQRRILGSRWWNAPVTVYGDWPNQPAHVIPFFTSAVTRDQMARARVAAAKKTGAEPARKRLRLLYVGRLTRPKNVDVLLAAVAALKAEAIETHCDIVGEGPERGALERQAADQGLSDCVAFAGGVGLEKTLEFYEQADVLALVSGAEGWGKVLVEAMAFGLVCIGSNRGVIPWMLGEGRGIVVAPRDVAALADQIRRIAASPADFQPMREKASAWAQRYTLEGLRDALHEMLSERWGVGSGEWGTKGVGSGEWGVGSYVPDSLFPTPHSSLPTPHSPLTTPPLIGVMQMTDTLDAGGAERVTVNLANLLPRERFRSYLCATRREGALAELIAPDVGRLNLARRRRFEIAALNRLSDFIAANDIQILHAHGASLLLAALAASRPPYPRVIWHAHYGNYADDERYAWIYRLLSRRTSAVIAVNQQLADWAQRRLGVPAERVKYIPNFVAETGGAGDAPELPGARGNRIVCVANLRPQKDHLTLVRAMALVAEQAPEAHLMMVGAVSDQDYCARIRNEISRLKLDQRITILGEQRDVPGILCGCDIGVLSSVIEGLPLALIEYGQAGLPSIATQVGQCPEVLDHGRAGILAPPGEPEHLAKALLSLLHSSELRARLGARFHRRVKEVYSPGSVIEKVCRMYEVVIHSHEAQKPQL